MDKNRPRMNSSGRKFSMARALEEESARLEQFFHFADKLLVHQEENDMVSLFDNCLIVGHQDFIVADYGAYGGTRWQLDFAYLFTHDFAGAGITVGNGFNRLGSARRSEYTLQISPWRIWVNKAEMVACCGEMAISILAS